VGGPAVGLAENSARTLLSPDIHTRMIFSVLLSFQFTPTGRNFRLAAATWRGDGMITQSAGKMKGQYYERML
jgi:hypothetical protein